MRSSTTRSGWSSRQRATPAGPAAAAGSEKTSPRGSRQRARRAGPSAAMVTEKPSLRSRVATASAIDASSSTTTMVRGRAGAGADMRFQRKEPICTCRAGAVEIRCRSTTTAFSHLSVTGTLPTGNGHCVHRRSDRPMTRLDGGFDRALDDLDLRIVTRSPVLDYLHRLLDEYRELDEGQVAPRVTATFAANLARNLSGRLRRADEQVRMLAN